MEVRVITCALSNNLAKLVPRISGSVDQSDDQAQCRVLLDDPLASPSSDPVQPDTCYMWVRCCPRVAVMGVENTLSRKRRLICEQHGGCKKGICNSLLQVPL
ncbi:hypothetical protein TNCV_1244931 [Trichonephila clavipes]|nr:hypothetical protein TNCV_1244931 [Trichonephila clavipes]